MSKIATRSRATEYQTRFENWDEDSYVRSKKPHVAPFDPQSFFFSAEILPLFRHPTVMAAPDEVRHALLVHWLYHWLEFTEYLELGPVNDACNMIRRPDFLPWLPAEMKSDALKIYTDEAGHAQMSHALIETTEKYTGISPPKVQPPFVTELDRMIQDHEPEVEPLIILMFAMVSETLITASLVKLPKDTTVQQAVRDLAHDHAADEAKHHAFFLAVCRHVWPRLPYELRRMLGPLLPDMILTFLRQEPRALERMLKDFPEAFANPRRIAEEVAAAETTHLGMQAAAQPTLKMLRQNGVFDDPEVVDAFREWRLVLRDAEDGGGRS